MLLALSFPCMRNDEARLTITLPEDLHEAFKTKCFLAKPRVSMTDRLVEFVARDVGREPPKRIDKRKLSRKEREALERAESKPKPKK